MLLGKRGLRPRQLEQAGPQNCGWKPSLASCLPCGFRGEFHAPCWVPVYTGGDACLPMDLSCESLAEHFEYFLARNVGTTDESHASASSASPWVPGALGGAWLWV